MKQELKLFLLEQHSLFIEILKEIDELSRTLEFSFILIGAQARDFVLNGLHGLSGGSTTVDIGIAIMVDSWDRYHELKAALLERNLDRLYESRDNDIIRSCDYDLERARAQLRGRDIKRLAIDSTL